jgi:hypothetical protein
MDLEQSCIEPGRWGIEGWTVTRTTDGWTAERFGEQFDRRTLGEVREEIADRIEQARGPW